MDEVSTSVAVMMGSITPLIVQLLRQTRWFHTWNGNRAFALALGIATLATVYGYLQVDRTPTVGEFLPHVTTAFTASQLVFRAMKDTFVPELAVSAVAFPAAVQDEPAATLTDLRDRTVLTHRADPPDSPPSPD